MHSDDPSCLDLNDPETNVTTRQRKQPQINKTPDINFYQSIYPASYKTLVVLLIYTIKFDIGGDRGKKTYMSKVKHQLTFEVWIFRSGQLGCDDNRRIFVTMTSTEEQRSLV